MKQTIVTVAVIDTSCFVPSSGFAQTSVQTSTPQAAPQVVPLTSEAIDKDHVSEFNPVKAAPVQVPPPVPSTTVPLGPAPTQVSKSAKPVESLRVRQMFLDRELIVAEIPKTAFPASVQIGDEFIATFQSGKQCSLKVVGAQGVNVTLDTKDCRYKFDLVVGLQLERSLLTIDPSVATTNGASNVTANGTANAKSGEGSVERAEPKPRAPERAGPYTIKFSDFSFMPKAGGFIFSPYIQRRNLKETYTINRTSVLATDAITFVGGFQLETGISERMKLGVQIQHSFNDQTDFAYGPASTTNGVTQTLTDKGFFDPRFNFEFQALDQNESPMSGFVAINVKPSFIEAKSATTTMDGTQGTGGGEYGVEGRLTTESEHFGFEASSTFTYKEKRTTKNESTNTSTETSGGDEFTFGLRGQAKLSPVFKGHIGAKWNGIGATEYRTGQNAANVIKAYSYLYYELGAKLVLVPDQFMLEGELQLVDKANTKYKSGTTETDLEGSGSGFRLSAKFLF